MKRSKKIALLTMGVSTLTLGACSDPKVGSEIYASVQECINQSPMSDAECKTHYQASKKAHEKVAPKFRNRSDCEAEFGKARCESSRTMAQSNGNSFFMPMMMGYMMSNRVNGAGQSHMGAQPLYRGKNDPNFRTAEDRNVGAKTGQVGISRSAAMAPRAKYEARRPNRRYASKEVSRSGGFGSGGAVIIPASSRHTNRSHNSSHSSYSSQYASRSGSGSRHRSARSHSSSRSFGG